MKTQLHWKCYQCLKDLHLLSQPLPQQQERWDIVVGDSLKIGMESNMLWEPGARVKALGGFLVRPLDY